MSSIVSLLYLASAILFVLGIKRLSRVRTARSGNTLASVGMLLAVVGTLLQLGHIDYRWIAGGAIVGGAIGGVAAMRVAMTSMPEFVALFNGSGGLASLLVGLSYYWLHVVEKDVPAKTPAELFGAASASTLGLSVLIGGITFTGSLVAFLQLKGMVLKGKPVLLPGRHVLNAILILAAIGLAGWFTWGQASASLGMPGLLALTGVSLLLGVLLVIPIGGADMPVVISLLNSYSGVAACATGFILQSPVLIITGAIVGASGIILTKVMCDAMNRSIGNVILGGFGATEASTGGGSEYVNVRSCGVEEMSMVLDSATSVVVVPGYGLAVSQAQHAARELSDLLEARGTKVTYAIHPVAGRMPGHMNVLLAEADVPYDHLVEMDAINPDLKNTDVAIVIGANDVVNPAALTDKTSPIWGMPIIEVHNARTVFVVKRSLGSGYAGVKNVLFERDNTMMVYGDAKKVLQSLILELKAS